MQNRRWRVWTLSWVSAFGLVLILAISADVAHGPKAVLAQESDQGPGYSQKEAQAIDRMLMCPVCVGVSIDQSPVEVAQQMKATVRELLGRGASRSEVLDYFVARYGAEILAAPPKSGANLLVWVLPIAGVLAALVAVFFIARSMVSKVGPGSLQAAIPQGAGAAAGTSQGPGFSPDVSPEFSEEELGPYLQAVDQDLALSSGIAPAPAATGHSGPDAFGDGEGESGDASKPQTPSVEEPREEDVDQDG